MLFYSGQSRSSSEVEASKQARLSDNGPTLKDQLALVEPGIRCLTTGDMEGLGQVLTRSWELKKRLSPDVTNGYLDHAWSEAMKAGALGGKLLGAGAGGALLFVVPPDRHLGVKASLHDLLHIPFKFESQGSQLIYYRP